MRERRGGDGETGRSLVVVFCEKHAIFSSFLLRYVPCVPSSVNRKEEEEGGQNSIGADVMDCR